jgi:hypothetical protein
VQKICFAVWWTIYFLFVVFCSIVIHHLPLHFTEEIQVLQKHTCRLQAIRGHGTWPCFCLLYWNAGARVKLTYNCTVIWWLQQYSLCDCPKCFITVEGIKQGSVVVSKTCIKYQNWRYFKVRYSKLKFSVYTYSVYSSVTEMQIMIHKETNGNY